MVAGSSLNVLLRRPWHDAKLAGKFAYREAPDGNQRIGNLPKFLKSFFSDMRELSRIINDFWQRQTPTSVFDATKKFSDFVGFLTRIAFLSIVSGFLIFKSKNAESVVVATFYSISAVILIFLGFSLSMMTSLLVHEVAFRMRHFLTPRDGESSFPRVAKFISFAVMWLMIAAGIFMLNALTRFGEDQARRLEAPAAVDGSGEKVE